MRIVSWNCAMGAHRKVDTVLCCLKPDLLVLAESACPEILRRKAGAFRPSDQDWVGTNPQKGLAVFSFGAYRLQRAEPYDSSLRFFLPIHVSGPRAANVLATWAFSKSEPLRAIPNSPSLGDAVIRYREFLSAPMAIMAGDFNAGVGWDDKSVFKFEGLMKSLRGLGLSSAFHGERPFGSEHEPPTFFDRTRNGKPFHIDYVFSRTPATASEIGDRQDWGSLSDHMPLIVDL